MAPLTASVIQALNANFRPPGKTISTLFPGHEFDEEEATRLADFCDRIAVCGYDFIHTERGEKQIQDTLDLGAEYGVFVESPAAPWYLGVFIIAECVMEPYVSDTFAEPMYRSEVFDASSKAAQDLASSLMVFAILCERPETAATRVEALIKSAEKAKRPISGISLAQFFGNASP